MNGKTLYCVFFCLILMMNVSSSFGKGTKMKETIRNVSLINLIANSKRYDRNLIRVVGYASMQFENSALFFSENDYSHGITKNGIWIEIEDGKEFRKHHEKYVLVEGLFYSNHLGHGGMYSGTIKHIVRMQEWKGKSR